VILVELVTMIWESDKECIPCNKIHLRRRLKANIIFQRKGKGGIKKRDCGSKMEAKHSALIVVRVEIILRSVGCFIHTYV